MPVNCTDIVLYGGRSAGGRTSCVGNGIGDEGNSGVKTIIVCSLTRRGLNSGTINRDPADGS